MQTANCWMPVIRMSAGLSWSNRIVKTLSGLDSERSPSLAATLSITFAYKSRPTELVISRSTECAHGACSSPPDKMNAETNRTCPFCAEVIKPAAKLCPRCRQWLTLRSFRNPVVNLWVHVIPLMALLITFGVAALRAIDRMMNPQPIYTAHLDAVHVIDSSMNWVRTSDGLRIYVTGILTNQSHLALQDIEFDCRFFAPNGTMVDAAHPRCYLTIQPDGDSAFRAVVTPGAPTNDYASHKLAVSTARNPRSLF